MATNRQTIVVGKLSFDMLTLFYGSVLHWISTDLDKLDKSKTNYLFAKNYLSLIINHKFDK